MFDILDARRETEFFKHTIIIQNVMHIISQKSIFLIHFFYIYPLKFLLLHDYVNFVFGKTHLYSNVKRFAVCDVDDWETCDILDSIEIAVHTNLFIKLVELIPVENAASNKVSSHTKFFRVINEPYSADIVLLFHFKYDNNNIRVFAIAMNIIR